METSKKRTLRPGVERSTYLQGDSLASLSAWPDNERERTMTAISGRKCSGPYERYDPLGSLVRTLLESSRWYNPAVRLRWRVKPLFSRRLTRKRYSSKSLASKQFVEILSKKDIPSNRYLYRLVPSKRRTGETVSSLLPTVQTQGLKVCDRNGKTRFINLGLLPTPTAQDFKRRGPGSKQQGLPEAAHKGLLPTPTAKEANKYSKRYNPNSQSGTALTALAVNGMLPTPTANGWKAPCEHGTGSPNLQTCVARDLGPTSQLNPLFVEEMMGFPSMWCALPFLQANGEREP